MLQRGNKFRILQSAHKKKRTKGIDQMMVRAKYRTTTRGIGKQTQHQPQTEPLGINPIIEPYDSVKDVDMIRPITFWELFSID